MTQTIRDLMHPGLITCPPGTSLGQVAAMLTAHHVHALVVADQPDKPLGIISDYDLLAGEWLSVDEESLNAMRKLTARDLMTAPIEMVDVNASVNEAAKRMSAKEIHRMLITEADKPVGIISISDFVAGIADQSSLVLRRLPRETARDVLHTRDGGRYLGAQRRRNRRRGVPPPGLRHHARAGTHVRVRARTDAARCCCLRVRHQRPRAAYVLPLP